MFRSASVPARGSRLFAWSGAALFAAALLYFLYTYVVTFGETPPAGSASAQAVLLDVLLFTLFALHHSVFARLGVRKQVARLVRPELERALYVWVASVLLIAVCAMWQPVAGLAWRSSGAVGWALAAVQVFAVWWTLRSATAIDVFELAGIRQLRPAARTLSGPRGEPHARPTDEDPVFKTTGPYGWVRHPIYAGWFLLVFAQPMMTMTKLVFAVTSCAYLLIAIPFEERSLRASAGDAYRHYTQIVRWKLIPGVY